MLQVLTAIRLFNLWTAHNTCPNLHTLQAIWTFIAIISPNPVLADQISASATALYMPRFTIIGIILQSQCMWGWSIPVGWSVA